MRRLTLKKETLGDLTTTELAVVVGAAPPTQRDCGTLLSLTCTSEIDRCFSARGCTTSIDVC